jgi:predicted nucleic acid-binding protein
MILLDTGYLVALFNPADKLHQSAVEWTKIITGPYVVTEYVLLECVNKFSKIGTRTAGQAIVSYVESHRACEVIYASVPLFRAGLNLHRSRPDKEWSLTDCISFHIMKERGITRALAHDIHFEQAGFDALLRRLP